MADARWVRWLARAFIGGRWHFLTGEGWPWPVIASIASIRVRAGGRRR